MDKSLFKVVKKSVALNLIAQSVARKKVESQVNDLLIKGFFHEEGESKRERSVCRDLRVCLRSYGVGNKPQTRSRSSGLFIKGSRSLPRS